MFDIDQSPKCMRQIAKYKKKRYSNCTKVQCTYMIEEDISIISKKHI